MIPRHLAGLSRELRGMKKEQLFHRRVRKDGRWRIGRRNRGTMVHGVGVTSWPVVAGAGAKHAAEGMAGGGCRIDALQTRVGGWALLWGS